MTQPNGRPKSASLVLDSAQLFERLARLAQASPEAAPAAVPAPSPAPQLFERLSECVAERLGAHAELTGPLLAVAREHISRLFPADTTCQLSEKEQDELQARLTALFDELEDILFALSLREQ
ncbi:MAG TPA: hypothetical protein PLW65_01420 [Pseudomonadota bacterium]|nr:hypothetical protein [Pseudomonadota bacterium]